MKLKTAGLTSSTASTWRSKSWTVGAGGSAKGGNPSSSRYGWSRASARAASEASRLPGSSRSRGTQRLRANGPSVRRRMSAAARRIASGSR